MWMHIQKSISLFLLVALLLSACTRETNIISLPGNIFGTQYKILYVTEEGVPTTDKIQEQVMSRLQRIDSLMSTWNKNSELSRFNRLAVGQEMKVDAELIQILMMSKAMHLLSQGTFDITVGPLVNLWGFGPEGDLNHIPSEAAIRAAGRNIGMHHLHIDEERSLLTKSMPLYVDLSAIAKGYAVDQVGVILKEQGIQNYLVEIGGELIAHGRKPNGEKWLIAIEEPHNQAVIAHKTIALHNIGMATSGDYRNYYERDGIRYSHTIDPRTWRPITHQLASATVIHPNAAIADALATALMVMGTEAAIEFAAQQKLAIYLITRQEDDLISYASLAFKELEQ